MTEDVHGLIPLLISRLYILNLRKSVLKNGSTVSMSVRDIHVYHSELIKAALK